MAIVTSSPSEGVKGTRKHIDPAAMRMLIDGQQTKQYKEPEKSAVREVFSNSVDAVSEKRKAISILKGHSKPEDYYIHSDEAVSKDSNFFEGYYDLDFLDEENDKVTITHEYNNVGKDVLTISDYGVGIGFVKHPDTGKTRIEGVLEIGYSTKRNTDSELGKWGIGAKSPLAIGSESGYLMDTRHNGKRFLIRAFDYSYHSMIGKFNADGGVNPHVIFYEGLDDETIVYYEETSEKNGTSIVMETLPSQRNIFKKAVTSQLKYFDNLIFKTIENSEVTIIPTQVELLYDGKYFCVPAESDYTAPHMLLNKVDYGLVNYAAMETEGKSGAIALKVNPSSVEVDRSRESLIWNIKTREEVQRMHANVLEEVDSALGAALDIENYAEWVEALFLYSSRGSLNESPGKASLISVLAKFASEDALMSGIGKRVHSSGNFKVNFVMYALQVVRTSDYGKVFKNGRVTGVLQELNISLQYTMDDSYIETALDGGVPMVFKTPTNDSISAGEKFSILKGLRDKYGPNVKEYVILEITTPVLRFLTSAKEAKLSYFKIEYFDELANKYKVNITTGDSELLSEKEANKKAAKDRAMLKAKSDRQNKIVRYKDNRDTFHNVKEMPATQINFRESTPLYGRYFVKDFSYEEDDLKFLKFINKIANKDTSLSFYAITLSHMPLFPTEECTYVRNFFTQMSPNRKFDYAEISQFLMTVAYYKELSEVLQELKFLNVDEYASSIYKEAQELFMNSDGVFGEWPTSGLGPSDPDSSVSDFIRSSMNSFSNDDEEGLITFIINIASFGRFAFENSSASEGFLANAYVAIMGFPEDTPLDSVPIGVEGINSSPINDIRSIMSKLACLQPIREELNSLRDLRSVKKILTASFKELGFTDYKF